VEISQRRLCFGANAVEHLFLIVDERQRTVLIGPDTQFSVHDQPSRFLSTFRAPLQAIT
jgi:hypothetical protein